MQLTGKEIAAKGIVYNYDSVKGIQQQGIDVRVDSIYQLIGTGIVNRCSSQIPSRKQIQPTDEDLYVLEPGYYEVDLMEGVEVPNNATLHFKTRSSLVRCGAQVYSGQFDAGFNNKKMGCFLHVIRPISIEKYARMSKTRMTGSSKTTNKENEHS